MRIVLQPEEQIIVAFADSDGEITVSFDPREISVHADMPDTAGREGVIYHEVFGAGIPVEGKVVPVKIEERPDFITTVKKLEAYAAVRKRWSRKSGRYYTITTDAGRYFQQYQAAKAGIVWARSENIKFYNP